MPARVVIAEGARADCKEAYAVIDGLSAEALLADHGDDADEIIELAVTAVEVSCSTQKESQNPTRV